MRYVDTLRCDKACLSTSDEPLNHNLHAFCFKKDTRTLSQQTSVVVGRVKCVCLTTCVCVCVRGGGDIVFDQHHIMTLPHYLCGDRKRTLVCELMQKCVRKPLVWCVRRRAACVPPQKPVRSLSTLYWSRSVTSPRTQRAHEIWRERSHTCQLIAWIMLG